MMKNNGMPTIDGHFWVERDGKIIDPNFPKEDEYIREANKTTTKKAYYEATDLAQKVMIGLMEKTLSYELKKAKMINGKGAIYVSLQDLDSLNVPMTEEELEKAIKDYAPAFGCCSLNAYTEAKLRGGRIVFGSQGWKKKDGSVWWEYGGVNYTTVFQFIK
jgi:hypothetical protein